MLVLTILGFVLVIFGAWLLVKLPDRPGGKIVFGKVEVSSVSAGLPLVLLGVLCVVLSSRGDGRGLIAMFGGGATPTPTPVASATPPVTPTPTPAPGDCFKDYAEGVSEDYVILLNAGQNHGRNFVPEPSTGDMFLIKFRENREPIGAMKVSLQQNNATFFYKIDSVVDRACQPAGYSIVGANDPRVIQKESKLKLNFGGVVYDVEVMYRNTFGQYSFQRATK